MIAVIARNESGLIVKAWVKQVNTINPLVAEATAILWAVQIAKMEKWDAVCFESDSKLVVECLQFLISFWSIAGICENVKYLAADFRYCSFCWVKREINMVAHTLAKLGPKFNLSAVFFPKNLPPLVEEAWFRDFICISSVA